MSLTPGIAVMDGGGQVRVEAMGGASHILIPGACATSCLGPLRAKRPAPSKALQDWTAPWSAARPPWSAFRPGRPFPGHGQLDDAAVRLTSKV